MTGKYKQPTREELAARHHGKRSTPPGPTSSVHTGQVGFADPGGVVSLARSREMGGGRVRVTGRWPG